jgi:hypothetical protein
MPSPLPFVWKDNSQAMHDQVINATPYLFRHFTRRGIDNGLVAHGCGEVTEDMMYQVVREVTPSAYLATSLDVLDKNRTTTP